MTQRFNPGFRFALLPVATTTDELGSDLVVNDS
jgi:hypothetical protein